MKHRFVSFLLLSILLLGVLSSCNKNEGGDSAQLLSFSQAESVEEMKKLDGKPVTIIGYMSTLSPISGAFMYLMNLPYQSCPFCVPNTTQLSNTIAVYAKGGKSFVFTDRAIRVTGTLTFGDYVDEFGYEYSYRITDASYEILDTSDMNDTLRLWQQLAASDVISEIYSMFEYVRFTCFWTEYTMKFGDTDDSRDYLYVEEALSFIEKDGWQYHYGFEEGYFDRLIATVEEVDATAFSDLVAIVREAEALSHDAYNELKNGNYTLVDEYSDVFGDNRKQYKLNEAATLEARYEKLFYTDFSSWIAGWEL